MYNFVCNLHPSLLSYAVLQVFKVLHALLTTKQSQHLLVHLFASLQVFVNKFPEMLFMGPTTHCAELCEQVPYPGARSNRAQPKDVSHSGVPLLLLFSL